MSQTVRGVLILLLIGLSVAAVHRHFFSGGRATAETQQTVPCQDACDCGHGH